MQVGLLVSKNAESVSEDMALNVETDGIRPLIGPEVMVGLTRVLIPLPLGASSAGVATAVTLLSVQNNITRASRPLIFILSRGNLANYNKYRS